MDVHVLPRHMSDALAQLRGALNDRYRVEREVGRGGMATVYLAMDLRHERRVALKVLHPELAAALGSERFLSEIRTTATLQHPNILPLFDSGVCHPERSEGSPLLYYVMPFVEGESLRERLRRDQQLPVDEAVRLTELVAGALDHAHRHGVIHRDIKPENILLSEGQPLVADFGIALAVSAAGGTRLTQTGLSVGTPQYMSPEQAAAVREVDRRTDIYSLGAVLYEMLSGQPPFTGATAAAITARKMTESVPPIRTVRDTVPPALDQVVRKALARTPADRFGTAQQFAEALELARTLTSGDALPASVSGRSGTPRAARLFALLPWSAATVLLVALVVVALARRGGLEQTLRTSVNTPGGTELYSWASGVALSPDGSTLVFTGGKGDSTRLFARRLDSFATRPLAGTEGGDDPFFSPDGRWVGYFARSARKLMKVALAGGAPVEVASDLELFAWSGAWAPTDTIYYIGSPTWNLRKVAAAGGAIGTVTDRIPPGGYWRNCISLLPDGRHALVGVGRGNGMGGEHLDVVSLVTGEHQPLLRDVLDARYDGHGHLLYVPFGHSELAAVPFDASARRITGQPVTVLDSLASSPDVSSGYYATAAGGTLAYVPMVRFVDPKAWVPMELVGRDGKVVPVGLPKGAGARFSPDGKRLVYFAAGAKTTDVFTFDLERRVEQRLTGDEGEEYWPVFSADGRRVAYNSSRGNRKFVTLDWRAADGSGGPDSLAWGGQHQQAQSWASGGAELVYTAGPTDSTAMDIWILPMSGARTPRPLMRSRNMETHPAVSPDGKWLAWAGDATGRPEVMVRRYPDGVDVQVSHEGAWEPTWGPGGRELFFRDLSGRRMFAAAFMAADPPRVETPRLLFTGSYAAGLPWGRIYDVAPDGRHFVMAKMLIDVFGTGWISLGTEIRIVPHFDEEVRRKLSHAAR